MALLPKYELTAEEFARLPDLRSCELVNGKIVPLTAARYRHGLYERAHWIPLGNYAEANGRGLVLFGEVGLWTRRDPDTERGADLVFISHERSARCNQEGFLDVAPELVVEILSPDDRRGHVEEKLGGVP